MRYITKKLQIIKSQASITLFCESAILKKKYLEAFSSNYAPLKVN